MFVADVSARTARLTDLADDVAGTELCAHHADRFSVPMGWEFHDERSDRPAPPVEPEPDPKPEEPAHENEPLGRWDGPARDDEGTLDPPESPLLARAFGNDDPGRLAIFERVEHQGEGDPEGLGEGEEHQGHHDGDGDRSDEEAADPGALRDEHRGDDGGHQDGTEADHGVEPYRADELPFPPFEPQPAPRAPLGEVDPTTEETAGAADRAPQSGRPSEHPPRRGLYEAGHGLQPTVAPARPDVRQGTV